MVTIKKDQRRFIVEWEGMDIEFDTLPRALVFVETIFKFVQTEIDFPKILEKAKAYDEIMARQNKTMGCDVNYKYPSNDPIKEDR